jgi:hypothetical protein
MAIDANEYLKLYTSPPRINHANCHEDMTRARLISLTCAGVLTSQYPSLNKRSPTLIGWLHLTWNNFAEEAPELCQKGIKRQDIDIKRGGRIIFTFSLHRHRDSCPVQHLSACLKHAMPATAVKSAVMANTAANNVNIWISSAPTQRTTPRDQGKMLSVAVQ